jgi:hypothetical protein
LCAPVVLDGATRVPIVSGVIANRLCTRVTGWFGNEAPFAFTRR